nr:leucine-rich repeat protein [Lachnospiraceae bacterium]
MKFSKELSVLLSMTLMAASSVSVSAAELPVFEEAGPIVEAAMDVAQGEEPSPLSSAGEMYTVEGIKGGRVQFDKNTGTITWFETGVTEALIPESIDGTTVTTIGAWVGQNSNIEKLSIPSTVTTLEEGVFRNMKITELTVPGSISQISKNSFAYNKYLKTVILESGVTEIGSYCFQYCDTLETLSMPKTLKKIGEYSFRSCADLESVTYDNRSFYPFDGDEDKYVTCEEGCFVGALFGHPDFSDSYKTGKWYRQLHEVTPTGDYLADLFAIAQSQMGYHEGNSLKEMDGNQKGKGDYAEYNYWWNEPGSMWCGEYVAWCLAMASTPYEIVHPKYTMIGRDGNNRNVAWTDTVYAGGEKAYELKKGDVILFRYKNGNHIILVESASVNGNVVTVESLNGNHSNDVSRNTYTINASTGKTINEWSDINGYVDNIYSPDFSIADELQYYTVTFDMQGGNASWSSKRLTDNASYGIMPLPAKTDYTFDGWYTAVEGGKKITSYRRARLSGDQTLYAHWTTGEQKPEEPETPEEPEIDTSKWSFDKTSGTITKIPYDWTGGTIPDQIDGVAVKAIGDYACSSRLSLKTLTIPGSVKTIGKGAFQACRAM